MKKEFNGGVLHNNKARRTLYVKVMPNEAETKSYQMKCRRQFCGNARRASTVKRLIKSQL